MKCSYFKKAEFHRIEQRISCEDNQEENTESETLNLSVGPSTEPGLKKSQLNSKISLENEEHNSKQTIFESSKTTPSSFWYGKKDAQFEDPTEESERDGPLPAPKQPSPQELEEFIPQEGTTNNIKIENYHNADRRNIHLHYDKKKENTNYKGKNLKLKDFSDAVDDGDCDSDYYIQIKMPKALEIKNLSVDGHTTLSHFGESSHSENRNKELELSRISEEIATEEESEKRGNLAKNLEPNKTNFFQNSFYSIVYLPDSKESCFCQLDENILKLVTMPKSSESPPDCFQFPYCEDGNYGEKHVHNFNHNISVSRIKKQTNENYRNLETKVKYFIELEKHSLDFKTVDQCTLKISILHKSWPSEEFQMKFESQNERFAFECVYMSILDSITVLKENKENFLYRKSLVKSSSQFLVGNSVGNEEVEYENCEVSSNEISLDSLKFSVERMSYSKAKDFIDNFDIILFKGKNIMSKMQRFFTNSEFDHVGLILKTVTGDLLLLEATGNIGVAIYSFKSIETALKKDFYHRIVIRKLCGFENESILSKNQKLAKLQDFVGKTNGKKYKFDPLYLLSSSVKLNSNELSSEEPTYFCSQLVAEALQVCQIMKDTKPSYKYLPKHFSDLEGLNSDMNRGYFYSEPIVLEH